jgi:hypothetical protein
MDILSYILGKKAGGGGEAVLINKNVDANGTYNASDDAADGYKQVVVDVPNSYGASDEGKVVSNGALVAQGSASYTANGTYDTTLVNEVEVNISGADEVGTLVAILQGTASGEVYCASLEKIVVDSVFNTAKSKNTTKVNFPNVTDIGTNFIYQHPKIIEIKMPKLEKTHMTSFGYLNYGSSPSGTVITALAFQSLKEVGPQAFRNGKYAAFDMLGGSDGSFGGASFVGTATLDTFIIRANTVTPLGNINNFDSTCFASGKTGGTLYVPSALISSYQSATNWSTILGYANNQIKAIEGSIYETQYADGTPIS